MIYDNIAQGIKVRSRCDWFEQGEISSKFFLNLEKGRETKSLIRSILYKNKEINSPDKINKWFFNFYQTLFSQTNLYSNDSITAVLGNLELPKLNNDEIQSFEGEITNDELFQNLKTMEITKSPGNYGFPKEFYEAFWNSLSDSLIKSIKAGKLKNELSCSQRQVVITLIEKKRQRQTFHRNLEANIIVKFSLN